MGEAAGLRIAENGATERGKLSWSVMKVSLGQRIVNSELLTFHKWLKS